MPTDAHIFSFLEDVWAPQVHALAIGAVPLTRESKLYVALDVNENSPIRPEVDRLMDATFVANQAVDKCFALDPARGLAMMTYGDGLLTKP